MFIYARWKPATVWGWQVLFLLSELQFRYLQLIGGRQSHDGAVIALLILREPVIDFRAKIIFAESAENRCLTKQ